MVPSWYHVTLLVTALESCVSITGQDISGPLDQAGVGLVVGQVVRLHLSGCHLVFISATQHSPVLSSILRWRSAALESVTVVREGSHISMSHLAQDDLLLQGLWGESTTTCRALVLDLTTATNDTTQLILRFLESSRLWQLPETRVVAIGGKARVDEVLLHPSLRNIAYALYLVIQDFILRSSKGIPVLYKAVEQQATASDRVGVYRRCLYCDKREAGVQFVYSWDHTSVVKDSTELFHEQFHDLMAHNFRVVTVPYFPYMDFTRDTDKPGTSVTPTDSVDTRLLATFTKFLNFTYEIYEDPEKAFGKETDGKFNGMMGQLQREEADFCTISAPSQKRMKVIQYLLAYPADLMTVISLKPSLLPKHLSLIRPFEGELWLAFLVSVVAWGVLLWLLQKAWWWVAGGRVVGFNTALLYGWGALLEQPPSDPSVNMSGRVMVGWWLVFSLIITTAYRSSLVAHMTVQGMSRPLETFKDLVEQDGWKWGTEPWLLSGVLSDYFSKHTDPVIQHINRKMEVLEATEALEKVLAGGYSLIDFENYITIIIATHYTDAYGKTPFIVSKKGFFIISSYGWSFRKGAPFYARFSQLMHRLEDTGIVSYWIKDALDRRVREIRRTTALKPQADQGNVKQEESRQVVLGLQHMQGAFYLLGLGYGSAFLVLLGEKLVQRCSSLTQ